MIKILIDENIKSIKNMNIDFKEVRNQENVLWKEALEQTGLINENTKVVILGDTDGIKDREIRKCLLSKGCSIIYSKTISYAVTHSLVDEVQQGIKNVASKYDKKEILVILGMDDAAYSYYVAETLIAGDSTGAGPLAGISLNLNVYHICEPEIKNEIDAGIYEQDIGTMEMVLDVEGIIERMKEARALMSN